VDEALRGEYRRGDDGRFYLELDGNPRGMVKAAELADANSKLSGFRDNNVGLKRELEEEREKLAKYEGIDPEEHARLKEAAEGIKKKGVSSADDIEAIVQRAVDGAVTPLNKRIEGLETDKQTALTDLGRSKVTTALNSAASKAGVDTEHALDDFLERGSKVFHYEDGKVIAKAADGTPLYNPDKPNEPLSPAAWAAGLAEKAPHLFKSNEGGGAGGGGGSSSTVRRVSSDPLDFGKNAEDIAAGKATTVGAE
jgi:predicted RecB family endonuclease